MMHLTDFEFVQLSYESLGKQYEQEFEKQKFVFVI